MYFIAATRLFLVTLCALVVLGAPGPAAAGKFSNRSGSGTAAADAGTIGASHSYQLTIDDGRALAASGDGELSMANTAPKPVPAQLWKFLPVDGKPGYFRIANEAVGDGQYLTAPDSADGIQDRKKKKKRSSKRRNRNDNAEDTAEGLSMSASEDAPAQYWKLAPDNRKAGFYRISNAAMGDRLTLDGSAGTPSFGNSKNGGLWKLADMGVSKVQPPPPSDKTGDKTQATATTTATTQISGTQLPRTRPETTGRDQAQIIDPDTYYLMTNAYLKEGRALAVGGGDKLGWTNSAQNPDPAQLWKFTPVDGKPGYFRITNAALGDAKALNGSEVAANIVQSGSNPGQMWQLKDTGYGYFQLSNMGQGPGKSLDTAGNETHDAYLAATGKNQGQYWKLIPKGSAQEVAALAKPSEPPTTAKPPVVALTPSTPAPVVLTTPSVQPTPTTPAVQQTASTTQSVDPFKAEAGPLTLLNCSSAGISIKTFNNNDASMFIPSQTVSVAAAGTSGLKCATLSCKLQVGSHKTAALSGYQVYKDGKVFATNKTAMQQGCQAYNSAAPTTVATSTAGTTSGTAASGKEVDIEFVNDAAHNYTVTSAYHRDGTLIEPKIEIRSDGPPNQKIRVRLGDSFDVKFDTYNGQEFAVSRIYVVDPKNTVYVIKGNIPPGLLPGYAAPLELTDYTSNIVGYDVAEYNAQDPGAALKTGKNIFKQFNPTRHTDWESAGPLILKTGFSYSTNSKGAGEKTTHMQAGYSNFSRSFGASVSGSGPIPKTNLTVSGGVDYKQTESEERSEENIFIYQRQQKTKFDVLVDPLEAELDEKFKGKIKNIRSKADAENVVKEYGTHWNKKITYGGDRWFYAVISRQQYSEFKSQGIDIKAAVSNSGKKVTTTDSDKKTTRQGGKEFSGDVEVNWKQETGRSDIKEDVKIKFKALGGDGDFDDWSVDNGSAMPVAFESGELWELVDIKVFKDASDPKDLLTAQNLVRAVIDDRKKSLITLQSSKPEPKTYKVKLSSMLVKNKYPDDWNANTEGLAWVFLSDSKGTIIPRGDSDVNGWGFGYDRFKLYPSIADLVTQERVKDSKITVREVIAKHFGVLLSESDDRSYNLWTKTDWSLDNLAFDEGKTTVGDNDVSVTVSPILENGKWVWKQMTLGVGAFIYEYDDTRSPHWQKMTGYSSPVGLDTLSPGKAVSYEFYSSNTEVGKVLVKGTIVQEPSEFSYAKGTLF